MRINDYNNKRTKEEFIDNIKICTLKENKCKEILKLYYSNFGKSINIEDFGIDNSGNFIEDDSQVQADPDWSIEIDGEKSLVEVMVHDEKFQTISLKKHKINKALKLGAYFYIFRNTYFLVFDKHCLETIVRVYPLSSNEKIYGGLPCYILNYQDIQLLLSIGIIKKYNYDSEDITEAICRSQIFK